MILFTFSHSNSCYKDLFHFLHLKSYSFALLFICFHFISVSCPYSEMTEQKLFSTQSILQSLKVIKTQKCVLLSVPFLTIPLLFVFLSHNWTINRHVKPVYECSKLLALNKKVKKFKTPRPCSDIKMFKMKEYIH